MCLQSTELEVRNVMGSACYYVYLKDQKDIKVTKVIFVWILVITSNENILKI